MKFGMPACWEQGFDAMMTSERSGARTVWGESEAGLVAEGDN